MSDREASGPYVYQPFGSVLHPRHNEAGRLWAIGGLHHLSRIEGLTKDEAQRILAAITNTGVFIHVTPKCDHDFAGWRDFEDGNGGEQVCKKCGMGAMTDSLRNGP